LITMCFEVLVKRISPTLKRITRRLNGHHSFFDDEDLYQEALGHLWNAHTRGVLTDKTDSYILQGCYFHLKNYLRKTQDGVPIISLNTTFSEDGMALEELLAAEGDDALDYLESKLQVETLGDRYLTEREKQVLELFLEGMSTREIGRRVGVSHVMVLKIRNKIKEKYLKLYDGSRN
jgi:RNA polymerase sigma factor (sigma-70 family)